MGIPPEIGQPIVARLAYMRKLLNKLIAWAVRSPSGWKTFFDCDK
jgi:hypothetical protein